MAEYDDRASGKPRQAVGVGEPTVAVVTTISTLKLQGGDPGIMSRRSERLFAVTAVTARGHELGDTPPPKSPRGGLVDAGNGSKTSGRSRPWVSAITKTHQGRASNGSHPSPHFSMRVVNAFRISST